MTLFCALAMLIFHGNRNNKLNQNNNKLEKHFLILLLMKLNNKNEIEIVKYVAPTRGFITAHFELGREIHNKATEYFWRTTC